MQALALFLCQFSELCSPPCEKLEFLFCLLPLDVQHLALLRSQVTNQILTDICFEGPVRDV